MKRRQFFAHSLSLFFAMVCRNPVANAVEGAGALRQITLGAGELFELPASPKGGEVFHFSASGDWSKGPARILGNGQPMIGGDPDLTVDINADFSLVYKDATVGWDFA